MAAPTIDNIVEELLPDFGVNALKPEQKEIISNITKKKDCIAVLPTGFGKSLPFQVYAAAQKRTSREAGHVLVCSPLIGLMKDQTKKLSRISYLSVGYKVKLGTDCALICLNDKSIVPTGEPGSPTSTGARAHNK
ncbi:ATP-dependent DNA helicase RecQ-like [Ostrea edulis]|uniref:ATP-dependent DNA helicase RecQ-like n=1 Tax=Ostrea edulis TaxID=37623 RepID=UPI0024AF30D9|nr:ATP-dependent DNA helicase RecQ-like [Ostrea edulis]